MDLDKVLHDLYTEKKRLDRAIVRLETRLEVLSGLREGEYVQVPVKTVATRGANHG